MAIYIFSSIGLLVLAVIAVAIIVCFHRLYNKATIEKHRDRFLQRQMQDSNEFLNSYDNRLGSIDGNLILGIRKAIAETVNIPPEYIYPTDQFQCLEDLTTDIDSIGLAKLVSNLMKEPIGSLTSEELNNIRNPDLNLELTVAEFISDVVAVIEKRQGEKRGGK